LPLKGDGLSALAWRAGAPREARSGAAPTASPCHALYYRVPARVSRGSRRDGRRETAPTQRRRPPRRESGGSPPVPACSSWFSFRKYTTRTLRRRETQSGIGQREGSGS